MQIESVPFSHLNSLETINPDAKCFKVKEFAEKVFIVLASTLATGALISAVIVLIVPTSQLAFCALTITATALGILLGLKLWQLVTPHLPEFLRITANIIQSFALSALTIVVQAATFPINIRKKDPKTKEECSPHMTPTLMIPGFLGSSKNWIYHRYRLKAAGYKNIFTIDLGSPFKSIDDHAIKVRERIEDIKKLTGRNDVRLLCHSMGGIVAMQYRYTYAQEQGIKVTDIVTLGTPLNGTFWGYFNFGISKCGGELKLKSRLIKTLRNFAQADDETQYYHIASKVDSVICPASSAGNAPNASAKVDILDATGHIPFILSDKTADLLIKYFYNRSKAFSIASEISLSEKCRT